MTGENLQQEVSGMAETGLEFSQLLIRHDRALLRYIMTFIPRRDDAEEVLQRTATALWEKYAEYDKERDFLPWALRFTYFEILNFRKEWARNRLVFNVDVLDTLKTTRLEMEPQLEAQRGALRDCLQLVDEEGLMLLRRRYCDSESISTLAEETGKTAKSLYRRLDRVRENIARCVTLRMSAAHCGE